MILRFAACALLFVFVGSASAALADDVGLSAAERAKNIKAYEARKAQGQTTDTSRGARGAGQLPQRGQQLPRQGQQLPQRAQQQPQRAQQQQQQAMQQAKRCQDAVNNAQNTAMGASVASSVVGFIPFGGVASSVVGAAAGVGSMAAGEVARQKMATGC